MTIHRTLFLSLLFLTSAALLPPCGRGQPLAATEEQFRKTLFPGEVRDTVGRLEAADRLAARQSWAGALDEYQRLLQEGGDDLVPESTPADRAVSTRRSVQLRRLCHLRIAALPPAALRLYRGRMDAQAKKWLEEGIASHDVSALRRVVDEAFCSRSGDRAAELLGDLAFEKGNFAEARHWWTLVVGPAGAVADSRGLRFPDPQVEVARVRARQILALVFDGELPRAAEELEAFRRLHGGASGNLAGRTGNYAATVQALLADRRRRPFTAADDDWPTFAGSPSRNRVLADALSERLWTDGPAWRVRLAGPGGEGEGPPAPRNEPGSVAARRLAFHPVIVGQRVLVADARHLTGYDLRSGRCQFRHDLLAADRQRGLEGLRLQLPAVPDLRYTLTAADGRLYVRVGAQSLALLAPQGAGPAPAPSYLVCLNLAEGARPPTERWAIKARTGSGTAYAFEGAPLVHDGRVYAAESCLVGSRTKTALVCHDADTAVLRWRREVCETPESEEEPAPRVRHHLLTLAGGAVVYCTHAGAVVAVDALTGKRLWGVRYPSRGPTTTGGDPPPRDLCPCVSVDRRLFVAPLDSDRILCLDAETGRTLWDREGIEAVHVLGVSRGRLLFTTTAGVRALDAATGGDGGGWRQPAFGSLPGFGRGLLAGGWLLWPTRDVKLPFRALDVGDGGQGRGLEALDPTRLRRLRPGNLAFGGGCLVVADAEELVGYVPQWK